MSGEYQLIPARHGTATFVPRGHTIVIRNTYGKQVIDTWAFALNTPPKKKSAPEKTQTKPGKKEERKDDKEVTEKKTGEKEQKEQKEVEKNQEESKNVVEKDSGKGEEVKEDEKEAENSKETIEKKADEAGKKSEKATWSSYLPTLRSRAGAKNAKTKDDEDEKTKQANTKTWLSYLPSGKGYTSYLPSSEALSAFASSHYRDPEKSYAEQLFDFSKTPVGAAGISAATGSGTASTLYAAYSAYAKTIHEDDQPMEYMSMAQTRARTKHLVPKVGDTLFSNIGQALMILVEDTSPGVHDTLIPACNPYRYRDLGVEKWEEHGSCSENLVLALKELNQKSGLKGARAVGAEVTVNTAPDPLNLFMNVPLSDKGDIDFKEPVGKKNDSVKFRAERDLVVVMSACPNDVNPINGYKCMVGHFMVESDEKSQRPGQTRTGSGRPPLKLSRNRSSQGPQPVQDRTTSFASEKSGVSTPRGEKKKPKKLEIRGAANAS